MGQITKSLKMSLLETKEAKELSTQFQYALLYQLSEVRLLNQSQIAALTLEEWNEVMEARFFSSNQELHFFYKNNTMQACLLQETDDSDATLGFDHVMVVDHLRPLIKKYRAVGTYLVVRTYYSFDEDGQAYMKQTRLAGIQKEGQANE